MVIRHRSPNYPAIDLGEAVELLRKLYPSVQRGEFTAADTVTPWGYSSVSGSVRSRIGALRQYGFLEQKKGGNARLSARALTLILRQPASNEHRSALRDAALEPPLFREMYDSGKHLAADDALRQHLVVERNFADSGAERFAEVLRTAMTLAGLADSDTMTGIDDGEFEQPEDEEEDKGDMVSKDKFVLSLSGGATAVRLEFPLPLTEKMWQQLTGMVEAIKHTVVKADTESLAHRPAMPQEGLSDNGEPQAS